MEELIRAIMARKGRRVGDEIRFCCPAHEDRDPSASFNVEKRAWHCQGCGASGGEKSLCEALGVQWVPDPGLRRPSFAEPPAGISEEMADGSLLTLLHEYRSVEGVVVGYAARYDSKDGGKKVYPFFEHRAGKWKSKAPPVPRPLYGLHRLAGRPDEQVWIVEGEKCADALTRVGLLAVTSQGGSKAVKKTDWSPLHGRNVVIWPDLDAPGAAYAADVRLMLNRCSITEIDPAACGLINPGADCADWLDAHPSAKRSDVEALPRVVIGGAPASAVATDFDWMSRLELNTYGKPKSTSGNTYLILSNDDAWKDAIGWNERSLRVIARKDLPIGVKAGEELQERHASEIAVWFYNAWRMPNPKTSIILTEVGSAAQINTFDPVRDWLATLTWDKVPRVDSWLINAAGCDDDEAGYNVAVGSKFLIGAVARALRPGCKLDTLPVLCGEQNTLKSTTLKALCHDEAWFSDSFSAAEIGSKDATLKIHGPWIIEIPEIDAMGKREAAVVKAFVSSATDRFRHPFGRTTGDHPRRCAFSATVNPRSYLSDPTGNRRFWTVQFRRPNIDWVIANREQLWAEAVARFKDGESWWFSREMEVAAAKVAERHRIQDSWEVIIQSYLDGLPPGRVVSAAEISADVLHLEPMHRNKNTDMRVAAILDGPRCRWVGVHEMRNGIQTTWYHPPIRAVDPVVDPVGPTKLEPAQTKISADAGGFEW